MWSYTVMNSMNKSVKTPYCHLCTNVSNQQRICLTGKADMFNANMLYTAVQ